MSRPSKAPEAPETEPPTESTADRVLPELEPLTDKELRFCLEYLIDLNKAAAARRAAYSRATARQIGYALYRKPNVRAEIDRLMAERAQRTEITADRVLRELEQIAFSDLRDFRVSDAGKLALREDADPLASRAVQSIKRVRSEGENGHVTTTVEIRLWSKPEAVRLAMQHLGMLRQFVDVHDRTLEQLLRDVAPAPKPEGET